jgi:hypothetical protein
MKNPIRSESERYADFLIIGSNFSNDIRGQRDELYQAKYKSFQLKIKINSIVGGYPTHMKPDTYCESKKIFNFKTQ